MYTDITVVPFPVHAWIYTVITQCAAQLAVKRFIDEACMVVTAAFTAPSRIDDMERILMDAVLAAEDCALQCLFQPDTDTQRRRAELLDTRAKMLVAKTRVANFVRGHAGYRTGSIS